MLLSVRVTDGLVTIGVLGIVKKNLAKTLRLKASKV